MLNELKKRQKVDHSYITACSRKLFDLESSAEGRSFKSPSSSKYMNFGSKKIVRSPSPCLLIQVNTKACDDLCFKCFVENQFLH